MMHGQLSIGFIIEVALAMALLMSTTALFWHMHSNAQQSFSTLSRAYSSSMAYFNSSIRAYGEYDVFER